MELSGGLRVGLQWPPQPFDVNPIKIAVAGRIQVVASELASNGLRKFQCGEVQKDQRSDETKRNENKNRPICVLNSLVPAMPAVVKAKAKGKAQAKAVESTTKDARKQQRRLVLQEMVRQWWDTCSRSSFGCSG